MYNVVFGDDVGVLGFSGSSEVDSRGVDSLVMWCDLDWWRCKTGVVKDGIRCCTGVKVMCVWGGGVWSLIYMDDGYSCCDTDMVGEYWVDGC